MYVCNFDYVIFDTLSVTYITCSPPQESTSDHSSEYWHVQKLLKHVRVRRSNTTIYVFTIILFVILNELTNEL